MICKVILLFCAVYAAFAKHVKIKNDEDHPLKWPSKYSVEARKYYMSSGFVENFKYWRSGRSSRLEANGGAVITISKGSQLGAGKQYEIHPVTTEEEINKIVCVKRKMYSLDEFLPESLYELKKEGKIALINHGPLTVTIDSTAIYMYEQGVFYSPHCKSTPSDDDRFVVTLVGYGERDDDTFWIIKNSMGPYWGTDGYIYISARDNNCGVMTKPIYVVV